MPFWERATRGEHSPCEGQAGPLFSLPVLADKFGILPECMALWAQGRQRGAALVPPLTQQDLRSHHIDLLVQVSDSFPYEWIKKKWREGFFVTCMATANTQWAVIMSRTPGIISQVRTCSRAPTI